MSPFYVDTGSNNFIDEINEYKDDGQVNFFSVSLVFFTNVKSVSLSSKVPRGVLSHLSSCSP